MMDINQHRRLTLHRGLTLQRELTLQRGLTLIEVLIALAIISIAMTAVIQTTAQNIQATTYLQNKTIATWVGENILNEARTGVLKLPNSSDKLTDKTVMLGRTWYWQAMQSETANRYIRKIEVKVFQQEDNEVEEIAPVVSLETYVYH